MEDLRLSWIDLKLTLLRCLEAEGKPQHRSNILGRPYQRGSLEIHLDVHFTPAERALATQCLKALEADGLVRVTHSDAIDPLNWLEITEAGKKAIELNAIDELDHQLHSIDPVLVEIRHGAWSDVYSHQPDSMPKVAHETRELIRKVLHKLAPDDEVRGATWFSEGQKIQRRHRIKLIMEKRRGRVSKSTLAVIETSCELVDKLYHRLSAIAHHEDTSVIRSQVLQLLRTSEDALKDILQTAGA